MHQSNGSSHRLVELMIQVYGDTAGVATVLEYGESEVIEWLHGQASPPWQAVFRMIELLVSYQAQKIAGNKRSGAAIKLSAAAHKKRQEDAEVTRRHRVGNRPKKDV
jgi:hypothetical protein